MTMRGTQTIGWDVENRVISVTGGATFVYDGDGNRVKKTEGGSTIIYINKYYEKNITSGEVTTNYYLGNKLIAVRKGTTLSYVMQDHLGSTSVTADSNGNSTGTIKYFSFGATRSSSGTLPTDMKFTGQRLDSTGLYYYGARYYDANIGRFISADTIVQSPMNPQTLNRYSYCLNNPLKNIDPSGNEVDIGGYDVAYIYAEIQAYLQCGVMISQGTIAAIATPAFGAYDALRQTAPELTNYLESDKKIVNITSSDSTPYAKFHPGMGDTASILVNPNYLDGDISLLTCFLGHEAFHSAIWMGTGHNRGNFAANEAFAYSFEKALSARLGINLNDYLTNELGDINPFMPQLEGELTGAAKILFRADPYDYGQQNLWEMIVNIFRPYQSHPLDNWSGMDKNGDKTLTVAKAVWIK